MEEVPAAAALPAWFTDVGGQETVEVMPDSTPCFHALTVLFFFFFFFFVHVIEKGGHWEDDE
jgi:hypothetical protein